VLVLLFERYLFVHRLPPALPPPDCHRYGKEKKGLVQTSWMLTLQRMATRGGRIGKKTVDGTAIGTGTRLRKIKMQRWISM
jgi:hypothetical protein